MDNVLIVGGAGFIGSHLVDSFYESKLFCNCRITIVDNFSTGKLINLYKYKITYRQPKAQEIGFESDTSSFVGQAQSIMLEDKS